MEGFNMPCGAIQIDSYTFSPALSYSDVTTGLQVMLDTSDLPDPNAGDPDVDLYVYVTFSFAESEA